MDRPDPGDEVDRSRYTLAVAYARARAAGYQPDSQEMRVLHRAEQDYEKAREHDRERTDSDNGTDQGPGTGDAPTDLGNGGTGQVSRVLDLRESRAWHDDEHRTS